MVSMNSDITVVGGGIAGQIAALVFAREGFRVICVDAQPAPRPDTPPDLRSTAFLMPSVRLLEEVGIFQNLKPHAAPLRIMRIADAGGPEHQIRHSVDFDAADVGEAQFGWNIPNAPMREVLASEVAAGKGIDMLYGDAVIARTTRTSETILRLESGTSVHTSLVVAADGRNSSLREMAGIDVTRLRYGQKAAVFSVQHEAPHQGISTEIHRTGGPFTLVPLAGADQRSSAVVWMDRSENIDRMRAFDNPEFERALNLRSCGAMGPLHLTSERGYWPIIAQFASRLTANRLALIGEAAHVVPPIGAQGLNMSLADIATLRDLMSDIENRSEIGSNKLLDAYQRKRWLDMRARVQGVDALNRASMVRSQPLRDVRQSVLKLIETTPFLRRGAIKTGLGITQ